MVHNYIVIVFYASYNSNSLVSTFLEMSQVRTFNRIECDVHDGYGDFSL